MLKIILVIIILAVLMLLGVGVLARSDEEKMQPGQTK